MAERILLVRLSALGDVLFALPALRNLRAARPDAHLTFLVEDRFASFLEGHPEIDELIVFPRRRIFDGRVRRAFLHGLRREPFDIAVDFQGNLKSGVLTRLSRSALRIGFASPPSKEGNRFFMHRLVAPPAQNAWRVDRDLALVRSLGVETPHRTGTPPALSDEDRRFAHEAIAGLTGRGPLVILHPGTSAFGAFKRWDATRYASLADRIHRATGARTLVTHGPGERDIADAVVAAAGEPITVSPATQSLKQLCALLEQADLVIGADTGPVHIAGLFGRPCIMLFGPKDPNVYRPMGADARTVRKDDVACSPCRLRYCPRPDCMETLATEDVLPLALELLSASSPRAC